MVQSAVAELKKKYGRGGTLYEPARLTSVSWLALHLGAKPVFLLHSLTACLSEIPQRFSSSSLPPEFAAGRCATTFIPAAAAA
ncbi:MAG: hypothetical protein HEQ39_02315 [Rhizobacter sp.]